jgi:hypothetical protein
MKAQLREDIDLTVFVINDYAYYAAEIPTEGFNGYWATSTGEIISTKLGNPSVMAEFPVNGYRKTRLCINGEGKHHFVHRLVMKTMFEAPDVDANGTDRWQVNHKDGCRSNNLASNLEWVSPSENNYHATVMHSTEENKDYLAKAKERDDARRS